MELCTHMESVNSFVMLQVTNSHAKQHTLGSLSDSIFCQNRMVTMYYLELSPKILILPRSIIILMIALIANASREEGKHGSGKVGSFLPVSVSVQCRILSC